MLSEGEFLIERSIFQTFWKTDMHLHQFFVFRIKDFKLLLIAYFFISFYCAKFQQDGTTVILDIL